VTLPGWIGQRGSLVWSTLGQTSGPPWQTLDTNCRLWRDRSNGRSSKRGLDAQTAESRRGCVSMAPRQEIVAAYAGAGREERRLAKERYTPADRRSPNRHPTQTSRASQRVSLVEMARMSAAALVEEAWKANLFPNLEGTSCPSGGSCAGTLGKLVAPRELTILKISRRSLRITRAVFADALSSPRTAIRFFLASGTGACPHHF
jgi:hypothetical protein